MSRRMTVSPLLTYMFRAATRSAHRFMTPLHASTQKPVKILPLALSSAHTTLWA